MPVGGVVLSAGTVSSLRDGMGGRWMWERVHHKAQAGNYASATTQHNRQGPSACIYSIVQSAALSWQRSRIKIGKKKTKNRQTVTPPRARGCQEHFLSPLYKTEQKLKVRNWMCIECNRSEFSREVCKWTLATETFQSECFRLGKSCIQEVADNSNMTRKQNFIICLHLTSSNNVEGFAASFNSMSSAGGHWRSCEW